MHRVDGVKRGPCLDCMEKLSAAPKPQPAAEIEQGDLFGREVAR
jgi:hypothetical protein